jgi:poly [ADP-ribose] polymerase
MISKSANYCCATKTDPCGLLVLSQVALGRQKQLYESEYIEKLPKDHHSVMGCGKTIPSKWEPFPYQPLVAVESLPSGVSTAGKEEQPQQQERQTRSSARRRSLPAKASAQSAKTDEIANHCQVPMGPPKLNRTIKKSDLLYNEYIVYDPDQVLMRYLVQVRFEFIA